MTLVARRARDRAVLQHGVLRLILSGQTFKTAVAFDVVIKVGLSRRCIAVRTFQTALLMLRSDKFKSRGRKGSNSE